MSALPILVFIFMSQQYEYQGFDLGYLGTTKSITANCRPAVSMRHRYRMKGGDPMPRWRIVWLAAMSAATVAAAVYALAAPFTSPH